MQIPRKSSVLRMFLTCVPGWFVTVSLAESPRAGGGRTPSVTRVPIPNRFIFADWDWNADVVVLSQRTNNLEVLEVLRISNTGLAPIEGLSFRGGRLPTFVRSDTIAFVKDGKEIAIVSLNENVISPNRIALGSRGDIGELRYSAGALWLYILEANGETSTPKMYSVQIGQKQLRYLGEGYYPRTLDGSLLYYVDAARGFSLCRVGLLPNGISRDSTECFTQEHTYMPQLVASSGELVIQHGVDTREIELLSADGVFVRRLSTSGGFSTFPLVSPSGSYVAYARYDNPAVESIVTEVVNLEGTLIYQTKSPSRWVNAAFRWAFAEDRLAVVVANGTEERALEFVTFPKK